MFRRIVLISRRKQFVVIGAVVLIAAVAWRFVAAPVEIKAAQWKGITQSPPFGGSPPLNTSESFQTKSGALTLGDGLTISDPSSHPDLFVGSATVQSQICWNDPGDGSNCKNSWSNAIGLNQRYLPLNSADSGWASVKGLNANPSIQPAALKFTAKAPTTAGSPSVAVWGDELGADPGFLSAGVYAQAGVNLTNNIALFGNNANPSTLAWAGYFSGNVAVEAPFDFFVGGGRADGDDSLKGELCIGDTCRSSWPPEATGDLYWFDSGMLLQPNDTALNLAVGGRNAGAPFYLQNLPAQSEVQLKVKGAGIAATLSGTVVEIR